MRDNRSGKNALLRLALPLPFKSRAAKLALAGVLIVAVAFAAGAFVVAPLLIDAAIRRYALSEPQRDVRVERVAVNPFNLTVDLSGAALDDTAAGTSVTIARARVNFGFMTLLGRAVVLDELLIEAPHLRVAAAGSAKPFDSLRDLVGPALPAVRPLRVEQLTIRDGRIDVAGGAQESAPPLSIDSVSVSVTNLVTDAAGPAALTLSARERDGASLRIDGQLELAASASNGRFAVQGVDLQRLRPWLGPRVRAIGAGGGIDAAGDYSLSFEPGAEALRLSDVTASLGAARLELESGTTVAAEGLDVQADLEVAAAGEALTAAAAGSFELTNAKIADREGRALLDVQRAAGTGVEIPAGLAGAEPFEIAVDSLRLEGPTTRIALGPLESSVFRNPDDPGSLQSRGSLQSPGNSSSAQSSEGSENRENPASDAPAEEWMFALRRAVARALAGDASEARRVAVRRIEIADGRFELVDTGLSPPAVLHASSVGGTLTGGGAFVVDLAGQLGEAGTVAVVVRVGGAAGEAERHVEMTASDVHAAELTRYFAAFLGREPVAGLLDADVEYRLGGSGQGGRARIGASHLRLGDGHVRDADTSATGELPLDLALTLLENPAGRAEVDVRLQDGGSVMGSVVAALDDLVREVAAEPFDVLGELVGREGDMLRLVAFEPGEAAPAAAGLDALAALGSALSARPEAALRIAGRADPELDREALAAQQVELHVALATAGPTAVARPQPVDFTSPRARDILDEFANERLSPETLATIDSYFTRDASGRITEAERTSYYRALFDALVENETIPANGLSRLARYRAQAIVDALADHGVAAERTVLADPIIASAAPSGSSAAGASPETPSSAAPESGGEPPETEEQPEALAAQVIAVPLELLPMSTLDDAASAMGAAAPETPAEGKP